MKKSVLIVLGILLLIPLASAGFFDLFTGKALSQNEDLSVPVGNTIPTVDYVSLDGTSLTLTEDSSETYTFSILVSDHDGVADLDDNSVNASLSKGATTRETSCTLVGDLNATTANYTCTITMWFFDAHGVDWALDVDASDVTPELDAYGGGTVTVNKLTAVKMAPTALTWPEVDPSTANTGASNDPLRLNNTGNDAPSKIRVNSTDLLGESDATTQIDAVSFDVDVDNVCDGGGDSMVNITAVDITGATLTPGNYTIGDGTGQEDLYFCLQTAAASLTKQTYSTAAAGAWVVDIVASV